MTKSFYDRAYEPGHASAYDGGPGASVFVESIQAIHGFQISNLEEIALHKAWITKEDITKSLSGKEQSSYSSYLRSIIQDNDA